MSQSPSSIPVDEVIVPALAPAPGTPPKSAHVALMGLSEALAHHPSDAAQLLVEESMRLTGADSAGITLEDSEKPDEILRWVAVTGEFAPYLNGTMPRDFSPCGEVLRRGQTLVMKDPARHYPYIADFVAPIHSALLVPFSIRGKSVGTLWVLSHAQDTDFTTDDVATVEVLSTFVGTLLAKRPGAK